MIGTANYRMATEVLAESLDLSFDALGPLLYARSILGNAEVNSQDRNFLDLRALIGSTYSHIVSKHCIPSKSILNMVKSLNDHVLKYYEHSSLDGFLIEQYLEVPTSYAYLSSLVGFHISEIGESSARLKDIDSKLKDINLKLNRIGWSNA